MRGRRGSTALAVIGALSVTACGADRDCAAVADDVVAEVQQMLDAATDLTPADLETAEGQPAAFVQQTSADLRRLSDEADDLGCSDERMRALTRERFGRLEAEPGTLSAFLLDQLLREGGLGELPGGAPATEPDG